MGLLNILSPEKNVKILEIEVEPKTFADAVTRAFRKNAANITVPGFRKGKAPRSIVEKMYGKSAFYDDALNEILPNIVEEAAKEAAIEPVSQAELDIKNLEENNIIVTAKYFVKPEVEVKNYTGIEVTKSIQTVSETDIDEEIERTRKRNARNIQVTDRPAADGDTVVIDFEGFTDGVPFDGGKGEKHSLKLGSGQFIPGFEAQIEGKNIGEDFDVNVTFPEDYQAEDLKGKEAVFKVKIHEINFEELPELDDEFAKDVSEFDTLEAYREDVKKSIEKKYANTAKTVMEEELVDALLANFFADIPQIMIDDEVNAQLRDYAYRLQQQGINMDLYLQYTGMTVETLRDQFKAGSERQVKTRLALEKIAEIEKVESTDEELQDEINKIAEAYSMEADVVKERVDVNILKHDIAMRKTIDFVTDKAKITEIYKSKEEIEAERKAKHVHDENCDHDHDDGDGE